MLGAITCEQVREGLREYLDADAGGRERELARGHLQECDACRIYAGQLRATPLLLADLPRPPMPSAMKNRLIAAYQGTSR